MITVTFNWMVKIKEEKKTYVTMGTEEKKTCDNGNRRKENM